jgi:hypothetical protein
MFEKHSLKSGRVFCNRSEKSYKKQLQKQWKASGNGECNLIKYVRCHHHTRYEATMCSAQILTSQPSNTILILRAIQSCVRKTHWEGAFNKKSISWIFFIRARVNDASDYPMRSPTAYGEKNCKGALRCLRTYSHGKVKIPSPWLKSF